jgi:hypothetical protein
MIYDDIRQKNKKNIFNHSTPEPHEKANESDRIQVNPTKSNQKSTGVLPPATDEASANLSARPGMGIVTARGLP